jgi:hypothetical protein
MGEKKRQKKLAKEAAEFLSDYGIRHRIVKHDKDAVRQYPVACKDCGRVGMMPERPPEGLDPFCADCLIKKVNAIRGS